ncbi:sigma-70 family RNA polymerase sigma factor [Lysinibacillus pakistanensis]|uniref:Sigma-70 family RNA polymerase sigma factor n=1 Tax=Lysinibacillus pakistanensis TaxID=759811 RepID=A0AAX3WTM2_9BACI|nr:sigma-70 family RNA polymerase sigma factor [Lysinibacillus pakistanensis]MDM5229972.1 sigma-70 family RNA polymerase sigma factor [Lysinibacillus pakistanensis]QGG52787.1 sigma-70 family RNA polymerase sigma factor [Lysinibacillus pakistanensis]WHY45571.1 sigma-70 family RNA polymerase sigma factor [Lysinibacillus pakistanensis]WHY50579.1 sigma-70 family RNA polymerase sigma factor [Lysinibacillus pakistanensis]
MSEHLAAIMDEHGEYCLRVAYLYVKDWAIAEEIVQDVFFAYYCQQERFEQRSSLKTYLVKITVHKSHDYLRSWKNKRHMLLEKLHIGVSKRTPEKELVEKDNRRILTTALFELPIAYREVLILYYYQELKIREIAEILASTENTVKTRLRRARQKLQEKLDRNDWEVLGDDIL